MKHTQNGDGYIPHILVSRMWNMSEYKTSHSENTQKYSKVRNMSPKQNKLQHIYSHADLHY